MIEKFLDGILRIDYGDGSNNEFYSLLSEPTDDLAVTHLIRFNHTYQVGAKNAFTVKATLANHFFGQEATTDILFENNMPTFTLTVAQNLTDTAQKATFTLRPNMDPSKPAASIDVSAISVSVNANEPNAVLLINNYSFNKDNSFSLTFHYSYSKFGLFRVTANCSNSVSFTLAQAFIKVGSELSEASGFVLNSFVNVDQSVEFFIGVRNDTREFSVLVSFNDSPLTSLLVPWTFISSRGAVDDSDLSARVRFNALGLIVSYKYAKVGVYEPSAYVSNELSSLTVNFCAKVRVQAKSTFDKIDEAEIFNPNCLVRHPNLKLTLNNADLNANLPVKLGKSKLVYWMDYLQI